jgi:hypothetical protein
LVLPRGDLILLIICLTIFHFFFRSQPLDRVQQAAQRRLRRLHDPRRVVRVDPLQDGLPADGEGAHQVRLDAEARRQQVRDGRCLHAIQARLTD